MSRTTTDEFGNREEAHRIVSPKDYPKTDQYPRFNGEGAYDLYGFIAKLELVKKDFHMMDQTILARMSLILEGHAALWYESQREEYEEISWEEFKRNLLAEYDTLTWQKKIVYAFEKDEFYPKNVNTPAKWVVRQCKRLKILERHAANRQSIHRLLLRVPGSIVNHLDGRIKEDTTIHQFNTLFTAVVENSDLGRVGTAVGMPRMGERRSQPWSPRAWKSAEPDEVKVVTGRGAENSVKPKGPLKPSTNKVMGKCFKCGQMVPDYRNCSCKTTQQIKVVDNSDESGCEE